jgi:hypothetical protein
MKTVTLCLMLGLLTITKHLSSTVGQNQNQVHPESTTTECYQCTSLLSVYSSRQIHNKKLQKKKNINLSYLSIHMQQLKTT